MTKRIGTVSGQNQYGYKRTISKDGLVLAAIALVSLAFGVGLYEQVGMNMLLSATIAAAAFFILFSLHYIIVQLSSSESISPRISSLERVVSRLARDMSQVDGMTKEIKEFRETCERIDRAQSQLELGGFGEAAHVRDETTKKLSRDVRKIETQIGALKDYFEKSNQENRLHIKTELQKVEEHIRQTTQKFSEPKPEKKENSLGIPTDFVFNDDFIRRPVQKANLPKSLMPQHTQESNNNTPLSNGHNSFSTNEFQKERNTPEPLSLDIGFTDPLNDTTTKTTIETITEALKQKRLDLYLQPIVALPGKEVTYYEVLTRLRGEMDEMILPEQYIGNAGIMPVVDNMMIIKSLQVTRKLLDKGSARGLFCNISLHSLLDEEFFSEFIKFMEKNREVSHRLFFDISQDMLNKNIPHVKDCLSALSRLGYKFSLDNVTNLDLDFGSLQRMGFRFIKVDTKILLNGLAKAGSRIHIADLKSYLGRYGLDLIAEKVESEINETQLVSYNIALAQGYHFSEPRPVRTNVFKDGTNQRAA